jgi:hypothetical protein
LRQLDLWLCALLALTALPPLTAQDDTTPTTTTSEPTPAPPNPDADPRDLVIPEDDDELFQGSADLSEDTQAKLLEDLDQEHGVPEAEMSDEDMTSLSEELGHEIWVNDEELYDNLFRRYAEEKMPLDADQEYYVQTMLDKLEHLQLPQRDELENLFRFYVFLLTDHEGMSFKGARRYRPDSHTKSEFIGYTHMPVHVPGVLSQFRTSLSALVEKLAYTRYRTRTVKTGFYRHIFYIKIWEEKKHIPDPSLGYVPNGRYADRVADFLNRFRPGNGVRGIRESDLMIAWMLEKYPRDFFMSRVKGWANGSWPRELPAPSRAAHNIYIS